MYGTSLLVVSLQIHHDGFDGPYASAFFAHAVFHDDDVVGLVAV